MEEERSIPFVESRFAGIRRPVVTKNRGRAILSGRRARSVARSGVQRRTGAVEEATDATPLATGSRWFQPRTADFPLTRSDRADSFDSFEEERARLPIFKHRFTTGSAINAIRHLFTAETVSSNSFLPRDYLTPGLRFIKRNVDQINGWDGILMVDRFEGSFKIFLVVSQNFILILLKQKMWGN